MFTYVRFTNPGAPGHKPPTFPANMAANVHDVIMLFGDSLTEQAFDAGGFGQKLSGTWGIMDAVTAYTDDLVFVVVAEVYARKLDVLNRGLSGYNTRWALPVLEQVSSYNSSGLACADLP